MNGACLRRISKPQLEGENLRPGPYRIRTIDGTVFFAPEFMSDEVWRSESAWKSRMDLRKSVGNVILVVGRCGRTRFPGNYLLEAVLSDGSVGTLWLISAEI